jgi:hypothetical protein
VAPNELVERAELREKTALFPAAHAASAARRE